MGRHDYMSTKAPTLTEICKTESQSIHVGEENDSRCSAIQNHPFVLVPAKQEKNSGTDMRVTYLQSTCKFAKYEMIGGNK